jgi:hypothetical protein
MRIWDICTNPEEMMLPSWLSHKYNHPVIMHSMNIPAGGTTLINHTAKIKLD